MSATPQERHVLILDDEKGRRSIALDAATYSLGRDQSNAIVLESKAVSRQQALLLRLPLPGARYRYRIVDGNSTGKPSANGMKINGKNCTSHDLANGDAILFGGKVKASYMVVQMEQAEFIKYLDLINYQSIKSEPTNAKETLVSAELNPEEFKVLVGQAAISTSPPTSLLESTQAPKRLGIPLKVWLIGIGGMMFGLLLGWGLLLATNQAPSPTEPAQTNSVQSGSAQTTKPKTVNAKSTN
uniref:FHA domain containing protein n=1 Tax=Cyanothece sp. (strain PCC 7425 / ATCC 29141) TaxID=395961 RepID=B8HT78_CYAP4